MQPMIPYQNRSALAQLTADLTDRVQRLERQLGAEDRCREDWEEARSAWESRWEANRSRIAFRIESLNEQKTAAPRVFAKRPPLRLVGLPECE